jgi:hypothetical protein
MAPMAAPRQTLYDILGVSRDATSIDIGLAYRKAIAAADRAVPPDATRQALVQQAHEILSNTQRRAAYDASLVTAAEKAAAKEQAAPDLDLAAEEQEANPRRKLPWLPIAAAVGVVIIGAALTLRNPPPLEPKVVEAPKPAAAVPPAPKKKASAEILAAALPSVGRVLSYDMSGRMTSMGLALAIEPGAMVTTCEGVLAGTQLVVKIGAESHSATLTITDETVGLCQLLLAGVQMKPLPVAPEEARLGDVIHALGANEKGDIALTQGTVKKVTTTPSGTVLELSMPIAPAGAGGAIFDDYGRLVGIATHRQGAGVPTALPASTLTALRSRAR